MSASRNTESLAGNAGQEFSSRVPPSEPLTTKGHKPGVRVGNEALPEFHAETYPAGTAPRENTFQPQPYEEIPGQALNPEAETFTDPASTLGGATSQDVHMGLGKPMQGQEGREMRGEHAGKRKKERSGLTGVGGSSGEDVFEVGRSQGADLPEGVEKGTKGKWTADYPAAEDQIPTSAEELAAERSGPKGRAYDYTQSR